MANSTEITLDKLQQTENPADFQSVVLELEQTLPDDTAARSAALLRAGEILNAKGQYQAGMRLLESAFQQAKKCHRLGAQALALGLMSDIFRAQGDYRSALGKLTEARAILGENPSTDKDISARLSILNGLNNMSLGDYDAARRDFYEAYQLYNQLGDIHGRVLAANRLGTIATMNAQYGEAEKYLQESLRVAKELDDRHAMAGALLNLGEIQRLQENPQAACPLYYEASALFAALGMHRGMCIAENNLGHIHVQMQDFSTAKYHYTRAVECAKIADLIPDMLDTLAGLVFIFLARQEYEQAAFGIAFIFKHPAHLQETEQFLEPAQEAVGQHPHFQRELPPPEQLPQIVDEMLAGV